MWGTQTEPNAIEDVEDFTFLEGNVSSNIVSKNSNLTKSDDEFPSVGPSPAFDSSRSKHSSGKKTGKPRRRNFMARMTEEVTEVVPVSREEILPENGTNIDDTEVEEVHTPLGRREIDDTFTDREDLAKRPRRLSLPKSVDGSESPVQLADKRVQGSAGSSQVQTFCSPGEERKGNLQAAK